MSRENFGNTSRIKGKREDKEAFGGGGGVQGEEEEGGCGRGK